MSGPMMLDPRVLEYAEARKYARRGLSATPEARERYRCSLSPYLECMAENTPERMRLPMMISLSEQQLPLGAIAVAYKATRAELAAVQSEQAVMRPEPVSEVEQLRRLPYAAYLKTPHWQDVRAAALKRAEHRCQLCCSSKLLQVHHRSYENKGQEKPADVFVVCDSCHSQFHGKKPKAA